MRHAGGATRGAEDLAPPPSRRSPRVDSPGTPLDGSNHLVRALVLTEPGRPLEERALPVPEPGPGEVLVRVAACGVCRTDLHIADGELHDPKLPLVLGHQVVGRVEGSGDRVGIPWLGWADGVCHYCRSGRENLCDQARFTGYHRDGGYAEYTVADESFCLPLPEGYDDVEVAPLLCAGLIGYRALRFTGEGVRLGLYGFGASAHIVAQVARYQGRQVVAFTRPGDLSAQEHALALGADWVGDSASPPPEELDAAIIFAPVGALIHDGHELLALVPQIPVRTDVDEFPLEQANEALERLRSGRLRGATVLRVSRG